MLKRFLVLTLILAVLYGGIALVSLKVFLIFTIIMIFIALVGFIWAALILAARVDSDGPDS